jgi:hypothetical protein
VRPEREGIHWPSMKFWYVVAVSVVVMDTIVGRRANALRGSKGRDRVYFPRMDQSEPRRDTERIPVRAPLYGEVKVFQPMTILDISHGGAQIETPFPLQLDSLHDFRLSLGERSVVVKGRIAHSHVGELKDGQTLYRTGVEFIEPSEHVQAAVSAFVEALRAGRNGPPIVDAELAE